MRKFLVICAAAFAFSGAVYAGSTGGRLSAAGSTAAEIDATAVGREPIIANPGSGADCPGGNCPAPNTPANQPAGGSYGYYYPGWSWGNPYGWVWNYQYRRPATDNRTAPADPESSEGWEPADPAPNDNKEGVKEMDNSAAAVAETAETEKKNHLVFGRRPGIPERNEFVLIDRQGRCLALINLFWKDPKKRDEIGVSVRDVDVDGIKTWRKELWDKIQEGMEGVEE